MEQLIEKLFTDLPRQGPGSDDATRFALQKVRGLRSDPVVFDLGCGTGAQSRLIASELDAHVVAVDTFRPFLERLLKLEEQRLGPGSVESRRADMAAPGWPAGGVDLIWCEGAVYNIGFDQALKVWRPALQNGGFLVLSECCWNTRTPAPDVVTHWNKAYPAMRHFDQNRKMCEQSGFDVVARFPLPDAGWWANYYVPLERRIADLEKDPTFLSDYPGFSELATGLREEISVRRRFSSEFDYHFFVLKVR